ncbi:hypothetical protein PILCRDRAFT_572927 [Piloderma croceum F 1598]|uniref:Uncharacterized protein n=1 Tax=Piloderma croceum (strain F 1598) TaxID=765440 RepID=A0A0C3FG80_PILCF|nr:hypothetical protein PILCRDRAFT_572927 [Piloderma croceum F 1598]
MRMFNADPMLSGMWKYGRVHDRQSCTLLPPISHLSHNSFLLLYLGRFQCSRCITSTTQNNRQTNGHRFVFHSSEVVGSVRHYVPGEPGVVSFEENTDADGITAPLSPPPLSSPLPMPLPNPNSPTWASASLPGPTGPGSVSASSSGSGSSGSGLFYSPGEGDAEVRRDAWRNSGSGEVRELGRGRGVPRGTRFMGPRSQQHLPTHPRADSRTRPAPPSSGILSTSLLDLVDVTPSGPLTEEAVQHLDDYEEPPSLVTSSRHNTNDYQFPYYLEGIDQYGSTSHQSRASTPQFQPQSPPLPPLHMTIPVPSSVYPHPAQNAVHAHDEPLSHTTHSIPLPAVPSHSPTSSSPSAASPSPASSVHLQASQRDRKKTLKKGDILYWHNLQKSGEIPGVEEDHRARGGSGGGGVSKGTETTTRGRKSFGMVIGGR